MKLQTAFYFIAIILFLLSALGVPSGRVNFMALGLVFLSLAISDMIKG